MARKAKIFGLMVALIAVSAVETSGAQAAHLNITSPSAQWSLTGEQTGNHVFTIAGGTRKVVCAQATLDDEISHKGALSFVEVTPTYSGCRGEPGNLPATITHNECKFRITPTSETLTNGTTSEVEIAMLCPAGKNMEIHIYQSDFKHAESVKTGVDDSLCTYDVGTHNPFTSVVTQTHNIAAAQEDIRLTVQLKSIGAISTEGNTLLCGKTSPGETTAIYDNGAGKPAEFTIKADWLGSQVGVMIG